MTKNIDSPIKTLQLVLIKPSKYDREGYIIQYKKGILPSNTLAVLYGLSLDAVRKKVLPARVKIKVEVVDETVQKINYKKIVDYSRKRGVKTLIALCGVQTNQFPRAVDIALKFREENLAVAIGGFHVSGLIALFPQLLPELEELADKGITLVAGEVDNVWGDILNDFLGDKLEPVYNFLDNRPALTSSSLPVLPRGLNKKYAISTMSTLDCGRGCPFGCSFCCVINVQGRKMRFRDPVELKETIKNNYFKHKITNYMFTDDNFARNKNWEKIFDMLIELRENDGIKIGFFMQIDTRSYEIPGFISKAARAGCTQAFIGVESLNPKNLGDVGKVQNHVEKYSLLNRALQERGIFSHAAYILGFPADTEESVKKDIQNLIDIGFSQASFFVMTPLPGAMDHKKLVENGVPMDADYNNFDSFGQVTTHPHLKDGKLGELYEYAWNTFQSSANMEKILMKIAPSKYYSLLGQYVWYKYAVSIDKSHPMISGWGRVKDRKTRRACFETESFFSFNWNEFKKKIKSIKQYVHFIREFEEIWLRTRPRAAWEKRVVFELQKINAGIKSRVRLKELLTAFKKADIKFPEKLKYFFRKIIIPADKKFIYTRKFLNKYWAQVKNKLSKGKIFRINIIGIVYNFFYEIRLLIAMGIDFLLVKLSRSTAS